MNKRDAVSRVLGDDLRANWSDRRIARLLKCSHTTVATYRREFEASTGRKVTVRLDRNRRVLNVAKIGRGHGERNWFRPWDAEWFTPHWLFAMIRDFYGGTIDTDPASCDEANTDEAGGRWATTIYSKAEDGLRQTWHGRVWANPPFGRGLLPWVRKAREQISSGAAIEIIMLVPHSPASLWFHTEALPHGHVCLLRRRLQLRRPAALHEEAQRRGKKVVGDNLWAQDLVYFGGRPAEFARHFIGIGTTVARLAT